MLKLSDWFLNKKEGEANMIGLLISIAVNFYAIFIQGMSPPDALLATSGFLVAYYAFCFFSGTIARLIVAHGNIDLRAKVIKMHSKLAKTWGIHIYVQHDVVFFVGNLAFIIASALMFFSGNFGSQLTNFNPWMFFGGILVLLVALVIQRSTIRNLVDNCVPQEESKKENE